MERDGWFTTEWGHERRQRDAIENLEASVSGAYREASRLRSQLSSVQGSMQSKLDRLARAFDAFVELSDIRADLAVYSDAAVVRHQVRQLLTAVGAGRTPVPPDLPEVPGYWLVPAARAVYARLDGDHESAVKFTEAATELDGPRTRYFLMAATRLAGPVDMTAVELAALLPNGRTEVDRAGRAFWEATAAGAFGDAGRGLLTTALAGVLGRPADGDDAAVAPWLSAISGGDARSSTQVANTLAGLRARVQVEIPTGGDAGDGSATADPVVAPLEEVVRSLVDEGHEPERELLRRSEKLRGLVETGTAPPAYRAWDEPVGAVGDLVRADIFSTGPTPAVRQVAVRAAAPWLRAAADRIADRPARPGPDTIRIRGRDVAIDPNGPDPAAVAAIRRGLAQEQPSTTKLWAGLIVNGVGLVVTVGGFFLSPVIGVLGIAMAVVGAWVWVSALRDNRERTEYNKQEQEGLDRTLRQAVEKYRQRQQSEARDRDRVTAERAALAELLF